MKIVKPSVRIENPADFLGDSIAGMVLTPPPVGEAALKRIEQIGRVCYKSEDKITEDSAERFVRMLIKRGHESVLEHISVTVRFVCDRGISHEIVRHRVASYSQVSTRYVNYGHEGEIAVIAPTEMKEGTVPYIVWKQACETAERAYMRLLASGVKPETARSVLPTCLQTEIVMTANLREWRHFLRLRTSRAAHPDMRLLARELLRQMRETYPVVFEDIVVE